MALTNYILASALIRLGAALWPIDSYHAVVWLGLAIGAAQALLSMAWLRYFRYGPLEWLWRCLTWWQRVPLTAARAR